MDCHRMFWYQWNRKIRGEKIMSYLDNTGKFNHGTSKD